MAVRRLTDPAIQPKSFAFHGRQSRTGAHARFLGKLVCQLR
jgi:hypothetical protein